VELLTEIPECCDLNGVPNTLTFQQYMLNGVSLATLNNIPQPNPITAVSRGAIPNTYILSTYRSNMEGLRAIMRLVFPHTIPQYFTKATFDERFKCNIHPASSTRYRNVHSEDLAPISENDILPVVPILNSGGNTPRHARNKSIAGNTPGGTSVGHMQYPKGNKSVKFNRHSANAHSDEESNLNTSKKSQSYDSNQSSSKRSHSLMKTRGPKRSRKKIQTQETNRDTGPEKRRT